MHRILFTSVTFNVDLNVLFNRTSFSNSKNARDPTHLKENVRFLAWSSVDWKVDTMTQITNLESIHFHDYGTFCVHTGQICSIGALLAHCQLGSLAGNRRSQFASIAFSTQYINCNIVGLGQTWNYTLNAHCAIPLKKTEDGCHHCVEWIFLGDLSLNVYWLFDQNESRVHRENRDWSLKSWVVVNLIVVYSYVWLLNQLVRILQTSNSFNIKVFYHIRILPLKVTARETVENISRSENISGEDIETFPCIMPDV